MKSATTLLCGILAWLATSWGYAWSEASLPFPQDFSHEAKAAQNRHLPILILFMSSDCPYCARALQEFLLPMQRNPEYRSKVIMRQIEINSETRLRDFSGTQTTQAQFAQRNQVTLVPTIKLFDAYGNELTPPIVGLLTPDFYGGIIDNAIDDALAKVRQNIPPKH